MARSVSDIKAAIIAEKNAQPALSGLTSTSQTSIWNLWAYIIAVAIHLHERLWDLYRADVEAYINRSIPGTQRWYHEQALLYQHGDSLSWIDGRFQYYPVDDAKRIVKRVAVSEVGGQVRIKISKESGGIPTQLTPAEESAFAYYINKIKFAGTNLAVINYLPDRVKLTLAIVYDPLVIASDGSLISDSSVFPVAAAVEQYLRGIVYGGVFNKTALVDALQVASGVIDPVITLAEGKADSAVSWTTIQQNYEAVSGYFIVDTLTVTYTPNV